MILFLAQSILDSHHHALPPSGSESRAPSHHRHLPQPKRSEPELPPWVNEPTTIQGLLDKYNVEAKPSGRLPGTTLFVVSSKDRTGNVDSRQNRNQVEMFDGEIMQVMICAAKINCLHIITTTSNRPWLANHLLLRQ